MVVTNSSGGHGGSGDRLESPVGRVDTGVRVVRHGELESFCGAMFPRLVRALTLRVGGVDVAEALAQDALSRVVERRDHVRALDDPEGYVFRTAFNLANSWWRRRGAERRARERVAAFPRESTDHHDQMSESVRSALATLTAGQREALVNRYLLCRSVRETAAAMGCMEGTVRALTAQAIAAMRSMGLDVTDG